MRYSSNDSIKALLQTGIIVLLLLNLYGCAENRSLPASTSNEYNYTKGNFRGRWWNYYQRGYAYSEDGLYTEAIRDFQKATQGREEDRWRARTYGMHFIDYFPRRELGIVYFQMKQFAKAIEELERSVKSAPSAKGHYFLNKARAAYLKKLQIDKSGPELHIEDNSSIRITNSFVHNVKGVAWDDHFVAGIRVADKEVLVEAAEPRIKFEQEVLLSEGINEIPITAVDLTGKEKRVVLRIHCDRRGPQVNIADLRVKKDKVTIWGTVSDNNKLSSLTVNGSPVPIKGSRQLFHFEKTLPYNPKNQTTPIQIRTMDQAGNETRANLVPSEFHSHKYNNLLLASLNINTTKNENRLVATDAVQPHLFQVAAGRNDMNPPFIRLDLYANELETFDEMILIEGKVSDISLISDLSLNGEPILNRAGKRIYFSVLMKLAEGENNFTLTAMDEHGNHSNKNFTITRKIKKIRKIGSRMSVAVLPFELHQKSKLETIVHGLMIDSFLKQKRFNVIERQKIEAILSELQLSGTDLVNPKEAVRLGEIVAAQTMLAGSVRESSDSIEIISRLIDTETSTVLASNDVFTEGTGYADISNLLDRLAFKFNRDFPVLEGIILEVRKKEVLIDIGAERFIKQHARLLCFREKEPLIHPVTGQKLESEPEVLGKLKIDKVYDGYSKAVILSLDSKMKSMDRVIVQ